MRQLSRNFLNLISTYVIETVHWSKDESMHDSEIERCRIYNNSSSIGSKSPSTPPDNPPDLQSKYLILDSNNINHSTLKDNHLDVKYLMNLLSEVSYVLKDNGINVHLEKWGGRGKKRIDSNPSVGNLIYDHFKQNVKNTILQNTL